MNAPPAAEPLAVPEEFLRVGAPTIDTEPVPNCPLCGGEQSSPFATGFDYELLTCANPWEFVECQACTHVWLNPRPAVAALPVIYPPNYYAYNYEAQISSLARAGKQTLDAMKMRSILRALPHPPRSFLDVGCGNGRFLKVMEQHSIPRDRLYGLELDSSVVAQLAGEGYQVFCERAETCERIPAGAIDLATMFHVIEHVDDPASVVRRVADWLAPAGVFAIETPNLDSWDARLFHDTYWGGYHFPRHWNLFRPATLERLLKDAGLEMVGMKYQTGHSFWMYSFHHRLRYGAKPHPWLAQRFNPFRSLAPLIAFTGFDRLRGAIGFRTSAMLAIARKPG